jgi:geranylgeranylglycerol-phosphate geranylgeranyltransferase
MGGLVGGTPDFPGKLLLAAFSGVLIGGGANAVNDCFDVKIDRINKPLRPIPAGLVSEGKAWRFSIFLLAAGPAVASFIHLQAFLFALFTSILTFMYSWKLKATVVWGNLTVSLITGLAFIYGGMAAGNIHSSLIIGAFAFLFHLGREIIKDTADMKGDRAFGAETLPVRYGVRTALSWATAVLALLILTTFVPYFLDIFNVTYIITVFFGVDCILIFVIYSIWRKPETRNLNRMAVLMKGDMVIGLLAVFLGRSG